MKIGILGAGSLGSVFGGVLAEGGHEVTLFTRSEEYREGLAGEAQVIPYGPMEIRLLGEGRLFLLPGGEVRVEREK